jgi:DNA-binding transcriptional regulator LsrR (DeoR family)
MDNSAPGERSRLDDAARAGWLYYVAGNTQDEIARKLGVSRQSAQRLVSLAVTERLIKVRLDHPIARCMELSRALSDRFCLRFSEVVPSDPAAPSLLTGIGIAGAMEIERLLKSREPKILTMGTGRALLACVEQMSAMACPHHRIVSLLGNMMSDGSATPYNAVVRMAQRVNARHYPMPLPVLARDREELALLHSQGAVHNTLALCQQADVAFVGVGSLDLAAPLVADGFVSPDEIRALEAAGAVGEITAWAYDAQGALIEGLTNDRVASAPLVSDPQRPVVGVAAGPTKAKAIRGALTGRLINGLITDEATATLLVSMH